MSFPLSSRFSDGQNRLETPSPAAYGIVTEYFRNGESAWAKPPCATCVAKCTCQNSTCRNTCRIEQSRSPKKQSRMIPRLSLEPLERAPSFFKPRQSLQPSANKENIPSPQKNLPFTKNRKSASAETQPPSMLTRPKFIHNCNSSDTIVEEDASSTKCPFNRHSLKRRSVKPIRKLEKNEDQPKKLQENVEKNKRPFDSAVQNLIREAQAQQYPCKIPTTGMKSKILKNTRRCNNKSPTSGNFNVKESGKKICKKDEELRREFAYYNRRSKDYYDIASASVDRNCLGSSNENILDIDKNVMKESSSDVTNSSGSLNHGTKGSETEKRESKLETMSDSQKEAKKSEKNDDQTRDGLKFRNIFAISSEDTMIFLINEEFIDDDYGSYILGLNGSKGHMQVLQNKELFEMTKYLVSLYLEQVNCDQEKNKKKMTKTKLTRSMRSKFGKLINKRKGDVLSSTKFLNETERIVRSAISELRGEFQKEIFKKTNEKLDQLISELRGVVLGANEDIDDLCERTTLNLISKLESIGLV